MCSKRMGVISTYTVLVLFCIGAGSAFAGGQAKVKVCHVPPDNPANYHTITVGQNALSAHLGHGDLPGSCSENCEILCDDADACTIDGCEPGTDVCSYDHPPVDCNDSDPCTTDTCSSESGCLTTPIVCDDGNACTCDYCADGVCETAQIDCGVNSICDPVEGCQFPCDSITCQPSDQCHDAGTCSVGNDGAECSDPVKPDGTPCDDGDESTIDDVCTGGLCGGTPAGSGPCDCCQAGPITNDMDPPVSFPGCPSCPSCEATVCSLDSYCCDTTWDGVCASEAQTMCTCCPDQNPGVCQ